MTTQEFRRWLEQKGYSLIQENTKSDSYWTYVTFDANTMYALADNPLRPRGCKLSLLPVEDGLTMGIIHVPNDSINGSTLVSLFPLSEEDMKRFAHEDLPKKACVIVSPPESVPEDEKGIVCDLIATWVAHGPPNRQNRRQRRQAKRSQ